MKMGTHVLVIIVLISSVVCATTSTSTEASAATLTTSTTGGAPSACAGGVGQLRKQYTIASTRPYTALVWVRPNDERYVVTCNPGCSPIAGYSATINATHTTLTIASVSQDDVGGWGLLNATQIGAVPITVCRLSAGRLPQCSISSDEDTDSLEPGTQLTLTVDVTGYYCSMEAGFDLTTGDVTEQLMKTITHVGVHQTVNNTFNITLPRLGDVTLTFVCGSRWNVICGGVQKLMKRPPQCTVHGDTDTNALVPGTNLTLTVDINNYYCPRETGFNLTTGHVTEELRASHKVSDISDLSVNKTFIVDVRRLGDVTLNFVCDGTLNVTCNGVQDLFKSPPQCTIHGDTDTNALVPGTDLTLTVDINNYYCPRETGFNLTTGHVTEELRASHKVSDISDLSVNKTFIVDVRRLGDVTLNFVCDGTLNVTCNGVQDLFKSPPQCAIHGDTDTNALVPGTNLTLIVDIKNFYCWRNAGFVLTTGRVSDVLLQNQTTNNITDTAVTTSLVVGADHLGDVHITYMCENTPISLTCGGVDKLTAGSSTPESITSTVDSQTEEAMATTTADSSTRAGSAAATAYSSTRAGSTGATGITQPTGGSSLAVTQETSALPTTFIGTTTVSLDVAVIAIIVVLVIVLLIVTAVLIVCCRRKYHAYRLSKLQDVTALQAS